MEMTLNLSLLSKYRVVFDSHLFTPSCVAVVKERNGTVLRNFATPFLYPHLLYNMTLVPRDYIH